MVMGPSPLHYLRCYSLRPYGAVVMSSKCKNPLLLTRLFVRKHVCMGACMHIHMYHPQVHYKLGAVGMTVCMMFYILLGDDPMLYGAIEQNK
jgi:hypothetical protein